MKKVFLILLLCILISPLHGGWPEYGWVATKTLDMGSKEGRLRLRKIHVRLSKREKKISAKLAANDKTNVALASVSLIVNGTIRTFPLLNSDGQHIIFTSGWSNNIDELQADDPRCYFKENVSISDICDHAKMIFANVDPTFESYKTAYDPLVKTKITYDKYQKSIEENMKPAACAELTQILSVSATELSAQKLKDLSVEATKHSERLEKEEKTLAKIGGVIVYNCWHSEQQLLYWINKYSEKFIQSIAASTTIHNQASVTIAFHIHSHFTICDKCSHSLMCSYMQPDGILAKFKQTLCARLGSANAKTPLLILGSYREELPGVSAQTPVLIETIKFDDVFPFPLCRVP